MLKTRVLAALVFAPVLLGILVIGGVALQLCLWVLALLMLWESLRLLCPMGPGLRPLWATAFVVGALGSLGALGLVPELMLMPLPAGIVVAVLCGALVCDVDNEIRVARAAGALLALSYSCGLLPSLYHLRHHPSLGLGLALMALFCTWGGDTGAYFAGRAFGQHKLMPNISPGKTREGAIGGITAGALVALGVRIVLELPMSHSAAIILGLTAATCGIVGDLVESFIKRAAGAKDSSQLIPGHGGVLDRFDGVLFAVWAVHLVSRLLVPWKGV